MLDIIKLNEMQWAHEFCFVCSHTRILHITMMGGVSDDAAYRRAGMRGITIERKANNK